MMKKPLLVVTVLILLVIVGVLGVAFSHSSAQAQPIPDGAHFKDVKRLSVGKKPACLSNVSSAQKAVDATQPKGYSYSFDLALGTRIIDMPAGYTGTTVHSFDNNQAKGTITFSDKNQKAFVGNLKNFNYTAEVNPTNNHWRLVQLIACQK